jgi:hypothetical protein
MKRFYGSMKAVLAQRFQTHLMEVGWHDSACWQWNLANKRLF